MSVRYIVPDVDGIHPARLEMSEEDLAKILQGIQDNEDWMTLEQIEAVQDYLFDFITAKKQTHLGEVILQ